MYQITDDEILPLCLKHNFWTWAAQAKVQPIPIKKADGIYFWDTDGKRYIDFNSMVMCSNLGHGNQFVIDAICKQATELAFAGPHMATKPRAILGKLLSEITPGNLNHFLYTLGGADANENAIKFARAYTGKHKILTRYRSYHGATHGAIALTGDPRRLTWEPTTMTGVVHFHGPYPYRSIFPNHDQASDATIKEDYLNLLEDTIKFEGPEHIAAILIEPVTGTNGILIPPNGYLQGLRDLCDHYNILLIADEVMTGFGRTGEWFAVNHWNIVPDIITMAKGITGGYAPLGAVALREEIAHFFDHKPFIGGLTYNGHPISLAAAIATIQEMQRIDLIQHTQKMGGVLSKLLKELEDTHPSVGDVRSIGLFGAIELVKDRTTKEPLAPYNSKSPTIEKIQKYLREQGLFLYIHWNVILIIPPLIINEKQLREGIAIIDDAIKMADLEVK